MGKIRTKFSVEESAYVYIQDYMTEHNVKFPGDAIAQICKEHEQARKHQWSLRYVTEVVTQNINQALKDELTKIRLASNGADKNTQILMELMNGLYFHNSIEGIITTSVQEMDAVRTAKKEVEDRIAHQRQKKIDWETLSKKKRG